jgi:hypothetical protein
MAGELQFGIMRTEACIGSAAGVYSQRVKAVDRDQDVEGEQYSWMARIGWKDYY